jgi:hypothetical protein
MRRLFGKVVFVVGKAEYRWEDVLLAACLWGDWAALRADARQGLACMEQARTAGRVPSAEEVTAAANEFRYERDLLSAEEARAWLAGWELSAESWMGFVARSLVKKRCSRGQTDATSRNTVAAAEAEVDGILHAELVCSGRLPQLCRKLAGRAAVYGKAEEEGALEALAGHVDAAARAALESRRADAGGWPTGLEGSAQEENQAALGRLEAVFQHYCEEARSPKAIRGCVASHELDWIRLDCQSVTFPDEDTAREAALCLAEDGLTLAEVAAAARLRVHEARVRADEIDASLKGHLIGARKGQWLGPWPLGGGFRLVLVADKILPSEDDPEVCRWAAREVVERAVDREIDARVRWQPPFRG